MCADDLRVALREGTLAFRRGLEAWAAETGFEEGQR